MDDPGDHAALTESQPAGDGRASALWMIALAVGAFALVILVVVLVRRTSPPPPTGPTGYDSGTRAAFIDACTANAGEPLRHACECTYDKISATVPFDRYRDLDAQVRVARPPGTAGSSAAGPNGTSGSLGSIVPNDVEVALAACVASSTPVLGTAGPPTSRKPTGTFGTFGPRGTVPSS